MKGWVGLVGWPIADGLPTWSPVSCRSTAGQRKLAGQRPTFYRWATELLAKASKGVFIATQLNSTQLTQLNSVQPSQSCFCLWRHNLQTESSQQLGVELSSVELCRYKWALSNVHIKCWITCTAAQVLCDVIGSIARWRRSRCQW